jgi:hypothetical protein
MLSRRKVPRRPGVIDCSRRENMKDSSCDISLICRESLVTSAFFCKPCSKDHVDNEKHYFLNLY